MERWVLLSMLSMFFIGLFNFLVSRTQKTLPNEFIYKQIFVSSYLVIAGAISIIVLTYIYFKYPDKIKNFIYQSKNIKVKYSDLLILGIINVMYLTINIVALSEGGGIATTIFGLATFVTIILNVIFMKYKVNAKILGGVLTVCALTGYVTYETIKLNKN
tara:strand:+ start:1793 stop:2272 length:480 start_codon:yes stop_codon:yes gene_type:complete